MILADQRVQSTVGEEGVLGGFTKHDVPGSKLSVPERDPIRVDHPRAARIVHRYDDDEELYSHGGQLAIQLLEERYAIWSRDVRDEQHLLPYIPGGVAVVSRRCGYRRLFHQSQIRVHWFVTGTSCGVLIALDRILSRARF